MTSHHRPSVATAWTRACLLLFICCAIFADGAHRALAAQRPVVRPQYLRVVSSPAEKLSGAIVDPPPVFDKAAPSPSETSTSCPGCLKSFWLVNTRCLPTVGCCSSAPFTPQVAICTCGQGCAPATLDDLLAEDSSEWFTVFFVHGNLTSYQDSIDLGHQLRAQLPERVCSGQPVRLIVWTWPSDSDVGRLRDDTALAGSRAATESYYLGRFATMLDVDQRMLVIGYSFGARITTGTLHLLAGCPLGGRHLADQHAPSNDLQAPRMRAVLLAAAIDVDWLIPGHFHGAAMAPVERMAITINPRDLALKKYRMAEKRNAPEPIGKVGPPLNAMGSGAAKIVTTNVASELGIRHGSPYYFASGQVMNLIRGELQRFDDGLLVARRK